MSETRDEANGWTLQSSIYEGFSTEIWADGRSPGQRTVAIVRDYQDAVFILSVLARALKAEEERKALRKAVHLAHDLCLTTAPKQAVGEVLAAALSSLSEAADQPLPKTETTLREASDEG